MFSRALTRTPTSPSPRPAVRRRAGALVLAIVVGIGLAACGDDSGSDDASTKTFDRSSGSAAPSDKQTASNGDVFNDADVQFATRMIPHHQQAIAMANMAEGRYLDPEVEQLVGNIKAAQAPEIETMTGWLTAWGKDVPSSTSSTMGDDMSGHDMGDMGDESSMGSMDGESMGSADMPGMMSDDDMKMLQNAPDAKFQDMWLQMMISHHKGAIEMARDEEKNGAFPDAVALANSIATSQQHEVTQMGKLLS